MHAHDGIATIAGDDRIALVAAHEANPHRVAGEDANLGIVGAVANLILQLCLWLHIRAIRQAGNVHAARPARSVV